MELNCARRDRFVSLPRFPDFQTILLRFSPHGSHSLTISAPVPSTLSLKSVVCCSIRSRTWLVPAKLSYTTFPLGLHHGYVCVLLGWPFVHHPGEHIKHKHTHTYTYAIQVSRTLYPSSQRWVCVHVKFRLVLKKRKKNKQHTDEGWFLY